jgi:hypothetical protein
MTVKESCDRLAKLSLAELEAMVMDAAAPDRGSPWWAMVAFELLYRCKKTAVSPMPDETAAS